MYRRLGAKKGRTDFLLFISLWTAQSLEYLNIKEYAAHNH